jgi:endonuclease III related protein
VELPASRAAAWTRLEQSEGVSELPQRENTARSATGDEEAIRTYYDTLARAWGPQHWWPASTRFEVIIGAYLTQNTAWTNVEQALAGLRSARLLSLDGIRRASLATLERLIRPSGYFRQKALRLKTFVAFVDETYEGSLTRMFSQPTVKLRAELLGLNGIGPETADSILLYAGNHTVFVVDAYTRRILERHRILHPGASYEEIRHLFEKALRPMVDLQQRKLPEVRSSLESGLQGSAHAPSRMSTTRRSALAQVYNEMHGLIVGVGKNYCRKSQPLCDQCPLQPFLPCRK